MNAEQTIPTYTINPERVESPTIESLKTACLGAGYSPSVGCFEDEDTIAVWSSESAPGTCGHPLWEAFYNKNTKWLQVPGTIHCKCL